MEYYVIYSTEGTGELVVKATSRTEARKIGKTVKNSHISAAVREDEGATITDDEKEFASTKKDPYRFVEYVG